MATKKDKYLDEILKVIKKHKCKFISDIFIYYSGCSRAWFYEINLDKVDTIKEAIRLNRKKACESMLNKWIDSDNPTLQIAAFRILSDNKQRKNLSTTYQESKHTGKIKHDLNITPLEFFTTNKDK